MCYRVTRPTPFGSGTNVPPRAKFGQLRALCGDAVLCSHACRHSRVHDSGSNVPSSKKTEVFGILYEMAKARGEPLVVTSDDVRAALAQRNKSHPKEKKLGVGNPANFLKDFIRHSTCNTNWPEELKSERITARQRYGNKQVLEFVPYRSGDCEPFPDRYEPGRGIRVIAIESLSIPSTARALGRTDEPWLIQVVVNQRIAHTHFATVSKLPVSDFTHLQMSVKTQPEIDALFVATIDRGGDLIHALVTCEAKQMGERMLEDQIREQVRQAFRIAKRLPPSAAIEAVVPIVVRVVKYDVRKCSVRGIYFLEFEMVMRKEFEEHYSGEDLFAMPLRAKSKALYVMKPTIAGVS